MSGVPYHAWTHRPKSLGGTDPIEGGVKTFRAAFDDPITPITTAELPLDWNYWDEGFDTSIFEPVATTSGVPVLGVDSVRKVSLLAPGWYSFQVDVNVYAGSPSGQHDGTVTVAYYDQNPIFGEYKPVHHAPSPNNVDDLAGQIASHWSYTYPLYDPYGSGLHDPIAAQWFITSMSSASLEAEDGTLEIHYLPLA